MTPRTWALDKVTKYAFPAKVLGNNSTVKVCGINSAEYLLKAEHARAVRIVKREIAATELLLASAERIGNEAREIVYADTLVSLKKVLAALQQGRTKGKL